MVLAHRFLTQSLSQLVTVARGVAGCIERVGCFLGRFSGPLLRAAPMRRRPSRNCSTLFRADDLGLRPWTAPASWVREVAAGD
jgi:hypothetical protein